MDHSHSELVYLFGKGHVRGTGDGDPEPSAGVSVLQADRNEPATTGAERDKHIARAVMCWNACLSLNETELTDMGVDGVARWMRNTTAVLGNAGRERDELAKRVKDLEAKRDELFAERDKAEAKVKGLKYLVDCLALMPADEFYKPGDHAAGVVQAAWQKACAIVEGRA